MEALMLAITLAIAQLPDDPPKSLWDAICQVESSGYPYAFNSKENAAGIAQIRPIYVDDVNRILGQERFTLADRWNKQMSWEMFRIYTNHWIIRYDLDDTAENRARIHNGGPRGWESKATVGYWEKVQRAMR